MYTHHTLHFNDEFGEAFCVVIFTFFTYVVRNARVGLYHVRQEVLSLALSFSVLLVAFFCAQSFVTSKFTL